MLEKDLSEERCENRAATLAAMVEGADPSWLQSKLSLFQQTTM